MTIVRNDLADVDTQSWGTHAGKSTLIKILLSNIRATSGQITVQGRAPEATLFGYCPQENALWPELSPRKILRFYGRLCGVPNPSEHASMWLEMMLLQPHADKPSASLSGGTKRKLCLAIALCGQRDIIVLDEPSAGVDTRGRRDLWTVIRESRKPRDGRQGSTILLTTHFMDDADALASRIAIMVRGQFTCLGAPQHLKSLHGSHHNMSLTVEEVEHKDGVFTALQQAFGDEVHAASATMPKGYTPSTWNPSQGLKADSGTSGNATILRGVHLADVFEFMEQQKEALHITQYVISQSSMEEVFLKKAALENAFPVVL